MPGFNEIVAWIFHVPSEYELLWWVLGAVMWYGFTVDRKVKALQLQLDELVQLKAGPVLQSERSDS
jgi:hypothetical protein